MGLSLLAVAVFTTGSAVSRARAAATGDSALFALDDAYIHLAIAQNLFQHGTWGVNPDAFSSTTSSPLWTLLLTALQPVAPGVASLFVALALSVAALVWATERFLSVTFPQDGGGVGVLGIATRVGLGAGLFLLLPLGPLALSGMEHVAHCAAVLLLLTEVFRQMAGTAAAQEPGPVTARSWAPVLLAALLCASVRLEGLLLGVAAAGVLAVAGRPRAGLAAAGGAVAPWALLGGWSLAQGWYFLPNGIVLKTLLARTDDARAAEAWLARVGQNLTELPALTVLLLAAAAVALSSAWQPRVRAVAATAALGGALHMLLGRHGWFFRYEAWLLPLLFLPLAAAVLVVKPAGTASSRVPHRLGLLLLLGCALGLVPRALSAHRALPERVVTTWRNHVQFARFLADQRPGQVVATTEAGAVTALGGARLYDLAGLGTLETAASLRRGTFGEELEELVGGAGAELVAVFGWFFHHHGVEEPEGWTLVGRWSDPQLDERDWLAFYAVGGGQVAQELSGQLRTHASTLGGGMAWVEEPLLPEGWLPAEEALVGSAEGPFYAERGRVVLYGNGEVRLKLPAGGEEERWLRVSGTQAAGEGARGEVRVEGGVATRFGPLGADPVEVALPVAALGISEIIVAFVNDASDPEGGDRNLVIHGLR